MGKKRARDWTSNTKEGKRRRFTDKVDIPLSYSQLYHDSGNSGDEGERSSGTDDYDSDRVVKDAGEEEDSTDEEYGSIDEEYGSIDEEYGSIDEEYGSIDEECDSIGEEYDSTDEQYY